MTIREEILRNQKIFRETFHFCEREEYLLRAIEASRKNMSICNNAMEILMERMKEGKLVACVEGHRGPGGLVRHGGIGWEEELCRCTTLYACLQIKELAEDDGMSSANKDDGRMLFIPDVICFRERGLNGNILPVEEWYSLDILIFYPDFLCYENRFTLLRKGFMEYCS